MQYVKPKILFNIAQKCTDAEIRAFLYNQRSADCFSYTPGVTYKDMCDATGMCKSNFYNVRDSLVDKGIYYVTETKWQKGYNFQLRDNVIRTYDSELFKEDIKGGYVDLNKDFLYSQAFMEGTCENEKKLTLQLLAFMKGSDKEPAQGEKDKAYAKYDIYKNTLMDWVKVTDTESINKYIKTLGQWFVIEETPKGLLYIYLRKENHRKEYESNIRQLIYKIKIHCRKFKIAWTDSLMKDITGLIIQYYRKGLNIVMEMILDTAFIDRELSPKLAHSRIKKKLKEIAARKKDLGDTYRPEGKSKQPGQALQSYKARTFNNFKNREYDAAELEQELLKRSRGILTAPEPI